RVAVHGEGLLVERFVEVEDLARNHRERGELWRRQGGIGLALTDGEEGFRAFQVRGELPLEISRGLRDHLSLSSGKRAQQHSPGDFRDRGGWLATLLQRCLRE